MLPYQLYVSILDLLQFFHHLNKTCISSPCLFTLYSEYIMQNARLNEAQARIKIAGINFNNIRYADDTTLKAEKEEEVKNI